MKERRGGEECRGEKEEIAATQSQRQSQEESIIIDGVVKNDEVFWREKNLWRGGNGDDFGSKMASTKRRNTVSKMDRRARGEADTLPTRKSKSKHFIPSIT